ncbi:NOP protein chaperone 1-like [Daphnia pulex]|uniref:NOP protein chaperone 1-like n=1 Tax=Daphnia pulex TaxID=6669 RepID=UPI001EDCB328|nr:NOP protein chaperone 1-like [Daphnia pulex]XP_046639778.1 NOP protein chaperone 1-like [Daphnia pulicaria]
MTSDLGSQDGLLKSTRHSTALLDVEGSKVKTKENLVFSLLQEKKRSNGTFKIQPSLSLQRVKEFLPQIMKANVKVQEEILSDPNKKTIYDIQNIDGASGPVIEMDVALYEDTDSDCSVPSTNLGTETNHGPIDENNIKFPGSSVKSNLVEVIEKDYVEQKSEIVLDV